MKPTYQGNAKPYVLALYMAADQAGVVPILQELDAKGLNLSYRPDRRASKSVVRRACAVLAFLSAKSVADARLEDALLLAKASNVPLVCVNLDRTPLNDSINRLLYASNIIFADRYPTPALLAERIMTAESLLNPTLTKAQTSAAKRAALLLLAGALAIVVVAAGLIIWQRIDAAAKAQQQTAEEPADIAGLLSSGMTEEDLLNIRTLAIVGDMLINASGQDYYRDWGETVKQMQIDEKTVWSMEGKEIPRGTASDISLIGRMSNLEDLILVNQSVTDLSPLQSLTKLQYVEINDCPVDSVEALSGMTSLQELVLNQTNVSSLAPLQSCTSLRHFNGSISQCRSLEGLGLPNLTEIRLSEASQLTDLDPLSACGKLSAVTIYDAAQLSDISGLAGCAKLKELLFQNAPLLRSGSALSGLTTLEQVEIYRCGISDLSWLKQSRGLKMLSIEEAPVRDLSWTSGMNQLRFVQTHGTNLHNLNFLKDLGVKTMELHFSGDINDYSGLAAIPNYSMMHLNPKDGNLAAALPYIVNSSFSTLWLYDCYGIDFSTLPQHINNLWITSGTLTNLEGISCFETLNTITLEGMNRLTSLAGLADCKSLTQVTIRSCARLTDYEDLYQKSFALIELADLPTAPDLSRLQIPEFGRLTFDDMTSIADISPLAACKTHINTLELRNMDTVADLSALENMQVVELVVPPQLMDQAIQLYDDGYILDYRIEYPQDELWQEDEQNFVLLSLDELDTLPDTLLSRVSDLQVIGDQVRDTDSQDWRGDWDKNNLYFSIVDRKTGESSPVGAGVIDQIDRLGKLKNLQSLRLYDQPLTNLQGIQAFSDLTWLEVQKCPLTDASAAFTLTQLEGVSLFLTEVTSIQGIQNLTKLKRIDLNRTLVTDLSPLKECNFDYAAEDGGLSMDISYNTCEEFSALASIPAFSDLSVSGHDAALWLSYLAGKHIGMLSANNCSLTNDQIAVIAEIPQLTTLGIGWNEQITDLSPLLDCKTLEEVYLSRSDTEALASIEGRANFAIRFFD